VVLYVVAMRVLFDYEKRQMAAFAHDTAQQYANVTLRQAVLRYALAAAVVVGAGAWLPFVGNALARAYDWNNSFVGTLFVAGATSLPELVVTLAALRLGALDMAIANLLGSNLFDIVIIAVDDLFFLRGPLLSHVSDAHAVSALSALIMTGAVVVGLIFRPAGRIFKAVGWVSVLLAGVYLANTYVLFRFGG
jgi:cation:H+ antiporter